MGRMAMGQHAMRWRDVAAYGRTQRGEQMRWDGKPIQMLHTPGFAPPRLLEVPCLIAAGGPKGIAVAHEAGDGILGGVPMLLDGLEKALKRRGHGFGRYADDRPSSVTEICACRPGLTTTHSGRV
jgi:alkanesulfonate monooxygenase SsuD/methylene tetrahydromethanopterin reductase-like flavin-dependent oxidoreductase (luciferase family)